MGAKETAILNDVLISQDKSASRVTFASVMADGVDTFPYYESKLGSTYYVESMPSPYNVEVGGVTIEDTTLPFTPTNGGDMWAQDPDNLNMIYVIKTSTTEFYSYNIVTKQWTLLKVTPSIIYSTQIVISGGKILLLTYHNGTAHIVNAPLEYTIIGDSWATLTAPTGTPPTLLEYYGIVLDSGNSDKAYVFRSLSLDIWEYTISTHSYTVLPTLGVTNNHFRSLHKNGILYFMQSGTGLFGYDTTTNETTAISASYTTNSNYTAKLFEVGDTIWYESTNTVTPIVVNTVTGIKQYAYLGSSYVTGTNSMTNNVFEYNGFLYSFSPYNVFDPVLGHVATPKTVLKIDLSVPHFYNLHKEQ